MSASQIAEYLYATSTRRKRIIREARFPKNSVSALYNGARDGLVDFLNDGSRSLSHLTDATDHLEKREKRPDATDWLRRDSRSSIEALDAFIKAYNKLGFSKFDCFRVVGKQPHLDPWKTTRISVNLDVTIRKPTQGNHGLVGGAIFLFSKGEASTKARVDRCKVIAGLIYTFCGHHLKEMGDADPSLCLAVDVFARASHRPPGTFAAKLKNVEDACEEIASRWKTILPPDDYDGPEP